MFADNSIKTQALVLLVASLHPSSPKAKSLHLQVTSVWISLNPQMQAQRVRAKKNRQDQWGLAAQGQGAGRRGWFVLKKWKRFSGVLIWKLSYDLGNLLPCGLLTRSDLSSWAELPLLVMGAWSQLIKNRHFNPQSEGATVY